MCVHEVVGNNLVQRIPVLGGDGRAATFLCGEHLPSHVVGHCTLLTSRRMSWAWRATARIGSYQEGSCVCPAGGSLWPEDGPEQEGSREPEGAPWPVGGPAPEGVGGWPGPDVGACSG